MFRFDRIIALDDYAPLYHPLPGLAEIPDHGRFFRGDVVRVRSAVEILMTLDTAATCEGVMFMPEMLDRLGNSATVHRRAERTCVEGHGFRRMKNAVFLEDVRCDGSAHDGCQRDCLVFWHEAWLQPADEDFGDADADAEAEALKILRNLKTRTGGQYSCQSTHLAEATEPLSQMHLLALLRAVAERDMSLLGLADVAARAAINRARALLRLPQMGTILGEPGKKSRGDLGLQAGEWVRVRDAEAIRATLGPNGRNLGLSFEPEMALLIGQIRQVERVVERMVHEETGRMVTLERTVQLKDTYCRGLCAKLCPRANPLFWRESWLERVDSPDA